MLDFLDRAVTPWHAVSLIEEALTGFQVLKLDEPFRLEGKQFLIKKEGTLAAIRLPQNRPERVLFAACHTDSPGLKLKPKPTLTLGSETYLNIEVYGAPIYSSFLNRDLAIAGKIYFENGEKLINLADYPVIIPRLALHLNPKEEALNPETHLAPLASVKNFDLLKFIETTLATPPILGHDLFLYPLEKARRIGFEHNLVASARIDNLGMAYALLKGFEASQNSADALQIALFLNHEEIGSETAEGSASPLFLEILQRIQGSLSLDPDWLHRVRHKSFGLSIDQAHGIHASYPEKHDLKHEVRLGGGIAIKSNAKKRYATSGKLAASLKMLCQRHGIPFQEFINRNDIPCGSTIGPILSTTSGFDIIDIGCPELSMHAAREVASIPDHESMIRLIDAYFSS